MKKTFLFAALLISGITLITLLTPNHPYECEYYVGEVLPPSGVCPDSLIVVNARGLDRALRAYDEGIDYSEYQLDSIFHTNCVIK